MADVEFAYVYDFGTGESGRAPRQGAFLNGEPLDAAPERQIEILAFEATLTSSVAEGCRVRRHRLPPPASWARSRCRSAISPPADWTPSAP
jgi:hypothetical protein